MCYEHGDASATSTVTLQRHKSQEVNPCPILIALPSSMDSNSVSMHNTPNRGASKADQTPFNAFLVR